jgi:hypothetical protein
MDAAYAVANSDRNSYGHSHADADAISNRDAVGNANALPHGQ